MYNEIVDHLCSKWLRYITIYQYMQMCRIPFFPCQPSVFAFSSSTTRLVGYGQGSLNWAFTSIVILTNPSSTRLNMQLKVIKVDVWCLLQNVCLVYRSLNLGPIFHNYFELSYVPFERIYHLYWTDRHTYASYAKCIGKCSMESKNLGGRFSLIYTE